MAVGKPLVDFACYYDVKRGGKVFYSAESGKRGFLEVIVGGIRAIRE
jgi:hypothetical protein